MVSDRCTYVTREYCDDKKAQFVLKDVCNARMQEIIDVKCELKEVNRKLDNHITHLSKDVENIKIKLLSMSAESKIDNKTIVILTTVITTLTSIILSIINFVFK